MWNTFLWNKRLKDICYNVNIRIRLWGFSVIQDG